VSAEAAHCAQDQDQFWAYYDLLFSNFVKAYTRPQLDDFARKLNLDMAAFGKCLDSHKYRAFVISSTQEGRAMGFKIQPTLIINQRTVEGYLPFKDLEPTIEQELKKVQESRLDAPSSLAQRLPVQLLGPARCVTASEAKQSSIITVDSRGDCFVGKDRLLALTGDAGFRQRW
jgi:hypothetical protein